MRANVPSLKRFKCLHSNGCAMVTTTMVTVIPGIKVIMMLFQKIFFVPLQFHFMLSKVQTNSQAASETQPKFPYAK